MENDHIEIFPASRIGDDVPEVDADSGDVDRCDMDREL